MVYGSGIRKKPIPDPGPGVKKAPDPQHWIVYHDAGPDWHPALQPGEDIKCQILGIHKDFSNTLNS